jgi:hypothetical protein
MDDRTARKELVFVIRMWAERDGSHPAAWRGRIEHVSGHAARYFTSLGDLCEFILARLREPDDVS